MRFALALSLFWAGCSSSSDKSTPAPTPVAADAARAAAADAGATTPRVKTPTFEGPHLTLSLLGRFKDPSFGAVDLPAVSADGKRVAFVRQLEDGGRGNPNLSLVIKSTADGRELEVIEVLAPEPRWKPEREAEVRERLARANRLLAAGAWTPMKRPSYDDAAIDGGAVTFEVGELTVRTRGDRLEIARGRQVVARRQLSRWLGAGDQGCPVSPQLRDASATAALALLEFGFVGEPGCWREPKTVVIRL